MKFIYICFVTRFHYIWKTFIYLLYCIRGHCFHHPYKVVLFLKIHEISHIFKSNTRHVCTYLIAFLMVIPNIVTKFNNFKIVDSASDSDSFVTFLTCRLLMPAAWKALRPPVAYGTHKATVCWPEWTWKGTYWKDISS